MRVFKHGHEDMLLWYACICEWRDQTMLVAVHKAQKRALWSIVLAKSAQLDQHYDGQGAFAINARRTFQLFIFFYPFPPPNVKYPHEKRYKKRNVKSQDPPPIHTLEKTSTHWLPWLIPVRMLTSSHTAQNPGECRCIPLDQISNRSPCTVYHYIRWSPLFAVCGKEFCCSVKSRNRL